MERLICIILLILTSESMAQTLSIDDNVKFLALGDSYTIGQSVATSERWPVQFITSLKAHNLKCTDARIIATTGWRTDNLKSAIIGANLKNEYSLVSLLIGVNNYYQGKTVESYKPEFEELLNMAITLAGGNKNHVFVVSIPDYGYTPFGKSNQATISQGIDLFNEANKAITAKAGVPYFNITDISRRGLAEPSLVAGDGLHPSGKMYAEWVDLILKGATIAEGSGDTGTNPPPSTTDTTHVITGIKDEQYGIKVSPNPFHDFVSISALPYTRNYSCEIVDSLGRTAYRAEPVKNGLTLDLSALTSGVYYMRLRHQESTIVNTRLVKSP